MRHGIILTGTRGSGKTTLREAIVRHDNKFRIARALTTRSARSDDRPETYFYDQEAGWLLELKDANNLAIYATYGRHAYAVTEQEIQQITESGYSPIVTATPAAAAHFRTSTFWSVVFIDASDPLLDIRLHDRGTTTTTADRLQRRYDRVVGSDLIQVCNDSDVDSAALKVLHIHRSMA